MIHLLGAPYKQRRHGLEAPPPPSTPSPPAPPAILGRDDADASRDAIVTRPLCVTPKSELQCRMSWLDGTVVAREGNTGTKWVDSIDYRQW